MGFEWSIIVTVPQTAIQHIRSFNKTGNMTDMNRSEFVLFYDNSFSDEFKILRTGSLLYQTH